jgi:DNA polymerase-3 subunit gamma/tau
MSDLRLNLARKWRSKDFDSIIGQGLSIRMLKNSLYLGQFFPVYLFSGQRGCGKTTTARVFAAAINCGALPDFQQSPKKSAIPCATCDSCKAMLAGKHPDFIEIDAASHTGVDNVRQIIEASSLLPLLGRKKIYLIDEAHMLSKAAFNAFLKILEEPPASVLFILATTDPQKIIETVRSRCFQLFFGAVAVADLQQHLIKVCEAENITYDEKALLLIIQESEGSVRDALNILEQVRFSAPAVTADAVLQSLGQLSNEKLVTILDCILNKGSEQLLSLFSRLNIDAYSTEKLYGMLVELARLSVWMKHGIQPPTMFDTSTVEKIISSAPLERLSFILQTLCDYEIVLTKTTKKHLMLEMLLLKLCNHVPEKPSNRPEHNNARESVGRKPAPSLSTSTESKIVESTPAQVAVELPTAPASPSPQPSFSPSSPWDTFITKVQSLNDPLLKSIFVQATYDSLNADGKLTVIFSEQFSFFSDWISESSATWLPLLKAVFGDHVHFNPVFQGKAPMVESKPEMKTIQKNETQPSQRYTSEVKKPLVTTRGKAIDVSDEQTWQKTSLALKHFPGTVVEIAEG